jgi:adenylate cyclase
MGPLPARRLRLASGLVLLTYLATHLANHALGLVSLEAMEWGRQWFLAFWRHPVPTAALYSALVVHILLALRSLYRRRHFRMPAWELTQFALGLALPPLLTAHVVGTRLAATLFGVTDSYTRVVLTLWEPVHGPRQALLITIAWVHGCMGLHFWLRLRPGYRRVTGPLFGAALLLPVLALLGFVSAGREVAGRAQDPRWVDALARTTHASGPAVAAALERIRDGIFGAYGGALILVLGARAVRRFRQRSHSVRIRYPDAREVLVPLGFTILEASRFAGIPHASVCGGRGRCSTCRVRVLKGLADAPPASPAEARVLQRVGAPPDVRLACQLRPAHDVSVAPVLPSTAGPADAALRVDHRGGREQELAVLFADLRGFTRIAEDKLPYDVVFVLNRYFQAVGGAITRAGGVPNQFTGDGVMALFGVDGTPASACRQALAASRGIVDSLEGLNRDLADELPAPLRIGIGVHVGPAIVGRMGYGEGVYLTAVGDTVHVASRLEQLTKEYDCTLVFSEAVAKHAAIDVSAFRRHELTVRNRAGLLAIRVVDDVNGLPLGEGT